jgi:hypothetical protein
MTEPWLVTSALYSVGRHDAVAGHVGAREGQLHAEGVDGEATDERHEHAGEQVLHGDHLVIEREDVLLDEAELVVRVIMGVVVAVATTMSVVVLVSVVLCSAHRVDFPFTEAARPRRSWWRPAGAAAPRPA